MWGVPHLGGVDVARKALILARTLGMALELSDVVVEPLYTPELAKLSVPDFLAALPTLDAAFAAIDEEYGSFAAYRRQALGLDDGEVAAFRQLALQ